jgi:hypothetical protein
MMRRIAITSAIAGAAAALVLPAVPAAAAPAGGDHCVVDVTSGAETCYATFRAATAAATGGLITDAPQAPADALASQAFADRVDAVGRAVEAGKAPRATVTLSIEYDWNYYNSQAGSRTYTAARGCVNNGAADWVLSWIGDDWNDRISSFRGYNTCEVDHFQHADFGTPHTGWVTQTPSMMDHTGLNNLTSSIKWG